jgi:Arc/MetJ-type ribon-helix-helix transcriptional regulator
VTEILTEPVSAPNVWRGDELAETSQWIIRFTEEDFADFERALAHVSKEHFKNVTEIRAEDFPLPHFQERIDDIVDRLEHGPGLVLLRGLPIYDRFSKDEATIIYWGLGRHMGILVPQNRKGDLIGDIRDLGRRGPYERAYATNEGLGFHTDSTDFVGLMCLRPALCGGESFVASSGLLYNFVAGERPEYVPILAKNFPTDWRSEEPPGSPGWYLEPLYSYFGGALSATVRTGRAMSAMRFPEVPRLTADEVSCFRYFDSLPGAAQEGPPANGTGPAAPRTGHADGMVAGMATKKVTITLDEAQLGQIRTLVQAGTAASVSGFVQHAVAVALDDIAGWGAMLAEALRATGGELSDTERAWADEVLGTGAQPAA